MAAISSAPSAEPCDSAVFFAFGAGQAITDFMRISVGFAFSAFAATIATSNLIKSTFPSLAAGTSITFHPYAR